jgi:hypothetical protein
MHLSFSRTTMNGPLPGRSAGGSGLVNLFLPLTLELLPRKSVSVDLLTTVSLPSGHCGLMLLKNDTRPSNLELKTDLLLGEL